MGLSCHSLLFWRLKRSPRSMSITEDETLPEPRPQGYQLHPHPHGYSFYPRPQSYQLYPPPPPQDILANRTEYVTQLRYRKYRPPDNTPDTPLFCLYRLYEFLVIDDVTCYRNTLEYFCKQRTWAVRDIPDPQDSDPARYAFLACLPALLKDALRLYLRKP